jgi:serine/threonine-protein kinase
MNDRFDEIFLNTIGEAASDLCQEGGALNFEPGQLLSHYRITERIAEGGMAVVYKAEDLRLGRSVALKFVAAEFGPASALRHRFEREARAASALNHPGICTIHDFDEHDGQRFIVMEYLEGETLKDRIERGAIPESEVIEIALQVSSALEAAHKQNIIHCDIKPANIFLCKTGQVKVLDFGIARLRTAAEPRGDITALGLAIGTRAFMSPEQALGEELDARTDIYSLGIVLEQMTGTSFSRRLRQIVDRMIEGDRNLRYGSISEVAAALVGIRSQGSPIQRKIVLSLTALVLVVVTLALTMLWTRNRSDSLIQPGDAPRLIAVLPFHSNTPHQNDPELGLGMADAVIEKIAGIRGLRVRPTALIRGFADGSVDPAKAGKQLEVQIVLDGRFQRTAQGIQVIAKLLNVADGSTLWSKDFTGGPADLASMEESIAIGLTQALNLSPSIAERERLSKRHTQNPVAYDHYLNGRYYWSKATEPDYWRSIEFFQRAIDVDPRYALAYQGRADSYIELAWLNVQSPRDLFGKAGESAARAVNLDPDLSEAHAQLARVKAHYDWDWVGADSEFQTSLRLNPSLASVHHFYSHFLTALGRSQDSLRESTVALELDPLGIRMMQHMGWHYLYAREYNKATEWLLRTVERNPNDATTYSYLGTSYLHESNQQGASAALHRALELFKQSPASQADLGLAYAVAGRPREALGIAEELERDSKRKYVPPYSIASIYAALGRYNEAFDWLEKAYEDRSYQLIYLKVDPAFDVLRSDPRFADLIRRIRIP